MERELGNPLDNPKHEAFAQEVAKGKTLCKAYVLAGYADDRGNASKLHQITTIKDRIKELTAEAAARAGVSIERVLKELAKIGFSNLGDYVSPSGVVDISRVTPEQFAAIGEVQTDTIGDVSRVKLKLLDKLRALNDLGRHLGMFVDKTETKVDGMIVVDPRAGKL